MPVLFFGRARFNARLAQRPRTLRRPIPRLAHVHSADLDPLPCRLLFTSVTGIIPPLVADSASAAAGVGVHRELRASAATRVAPGLLHTTAALSQPRQSSVGVTVGSQALFAGGDAGSGQGNATVDIYDAPSGRWSTAPLSRHDMAPAATTSGQLAFFADGSTVDIYDASTGVWSTAALSESRHVMSAASVAGQVIFAGGFLDEQPSVLSAAVDIYDIATGRWSTASLSQARSDMAVTVVGTKAIFAGGGFYDANANLHESDVVDIYDAATGHWATATLSQARSFATAAVVGDLAIFAGGSPQGSGGPGSLPTQTDVVDIYDASTGQWSTATLSEARDGIAGTTIGQRVLFAGGIHGLRLSDAVDIYDATTNHWSAGRLSEARTSIASATLGHMAIFAGGSLGLGLSPFTDTVDIYDADTGGRSTGRLAQPRVVDATVTLGSRAILAGGSKAGDSSGSYVPTEAVDIFTMDTFPPTATLVSSVTRTRARASYTFAVSYHDPFGINTDTINRNDIVIDGPAGFEARATVVSQSRGKSAGTRIVTYAIHAPGRRWDASDNGVYTMHLQDGQVTDIAGNAAIGRRLGTLTVAIPAASPTSAAPSAVTIQRTLTAFQVRRKISDLLES